MAKKVEIEIDIKGGKEVKGLGQEIRDLTKQLRQTPEGTKEWSQIYNKIDDLKDKMAAAKATSADWIDSLESAGGPLGMLGAGLNKLKVSTQSFGAALKATGIGLVVSAIGLLVAAFSQTEGSMKKLEPLLIGMEKIFGGIVEALQPALEMILNLGMKALPIVMDVIKETTAYTIAFVKSLGSIGSALMKIFKGDFKGAWEDAKSSVTDFGKNHDQVVKDFEKGSAKMTKTQKENAKTSKEAADKLLAERLKMLDANDKLDAAELEKQKQLALAETFNDEQRLGVEKAFYEKSYQMKKKDLEDKQKLYKKSSVEYKDLQTQLTTLDAEKIGKDKEFSDKQIEIAKNRTKEIVDFEVNLAKRLQEIDEEKQAKKLADMQSELSLDESRLKSLTENTMAYFEQQRKIEDDNYALQKEKFKGNKKELERIEQDHNNVIKAIDKTTKEFKQQQLLATIDMYAQFGASLQQLAGKNKGLAIAGLIVENAAGIAKIIINTQIAASKAGYFTPLGIATIIAGAASVATSIAATVKGIQQINGSGGGSSASASAPPAGANSAAALGKNYGNGGLLEGPRHAQGGVMINAEGGEAVMTRGAVTMFAPLLSAMNMAGGGVSFASGAMGGSRPDSAMLSNPAQEQQPLIMKTYVVSNELTTEAQKQARLKDLSTL